MQRSGVWQSPNQFTEVLFQCFTDGWRLLRYARNDEW